MTTDTDTLARLERMIAELRSARAPEVGVQAFPTNVASGELIESAWGNAVVDELARLRNGTRPIAGAFQGTGGTSGGGLQIADGLVPAQTVAGTVSIWVLLRVDVSSGTAYDLELLVAGVVLARWTMATFSGFHMVNLSTTAQTIAGTGAQIVVRGAGTANVTVYADPKVNRVDWLWLPNRNV